MALSILNNITALKAENVLTQTNTSLQTTLYRLASGSKLNSGADDAAGLSIANGLEANVDALTQSASNATDGVGELDTADGALSQVTSLLDRAVTLATEASTSTIDSTQASSLNTEYQSILAEIDTIGEKTTYNDVNVFGSTGGGNGTWTFSGGTAGTGGQDITLTDTSTGHTISLTTATTDDANSIANTINTDAAASATAMNVKASVNSSGDLVITDETGTNSIQVTTSGTTTDLGTVTEGENTTTNANTWESSNTATLTSGSALTSGDTLTLTDSDTGTSVTYTFGTSGTESVNGGTATAVTGGLSTVGELVSAINANTTAGNLNVTASLTTDGKLEIQDASGNGSIYMTTADTVLGGTASTNGMTDTLANAGSTLQVYLGDGTTTTSANTISVNLSQLSASTLGLTSDLTSTSGAQTALTQITAAISTVAQERGTVGAAVNRLTAASNVETTQVENLTSAENDLTAADVSSEVSDMTKYNVLLQTGISALTEANSMESDITKLLQ